jgi:hypothetical protein
VLLQEIADHMLSAHIESAEARETARYCLLGPLGRGPLALNCPWPPEPVTFRQPCVLAAFPSRSHPV